MFIDFNAFTGLSVFAGINLLIVVVGVEQGFPFITFGEEHHNAVDILAVRIRHDPYGSFTAGENAREYRNIVLMSFSGKTFVFKLTAERRHAAFNRYTFE